ncbi:MAG: ribose 5-phosphate isomerase A [Ignavibacteriae bacterium HGW-Ignavibacteriae-3]|nr:MAG: ribose 5-phosphate isomerase A [Ignavibacteriae bacterium HGW-Ignavibacteriae-3]
MDINQLKKLAAEKAVDEIKSGMVVGLGTGSTVQYALEEISGRIKNGLLKDILCIPSSSNTEREAERLGIPLTTFEELRITDSQFSILNSKFLIAVTIDGADEVAIDEATKKINLIKGGGGALLREKIVAQASRRLIIMVDESKMSDHLGKKWAVPVEVIPFAVSVEEEFLKSLGAKVTRRKKADGSDYITDENNFILDANFGVIKDPANISIILHERAGIVEHGLFIGMADKIICAKFRGIEVIEHGPAYHAFGR